MKRIAAILLGSLCLVFAAHASFAARGFGPGSKTHAIAVSGSLSVLDPYLVAPNDLSNIDLSKFLGGNPNLANYSAAALAADSSSAAIVLFETDSLSDVTFSVTQGTATLLPYAANFLTQAPQVGNTSLTVTSGSFISANGHYYAPALAQGPLGGYSAANTIGIDATQDGGSTQTSFALVIPPLVLAHGLWGDKTSLQELEEYVDAVSPWKTQTQLVVPICYSIYLAFDAVNDPIGGKDPCEVTSEAALQTEIDSLMAELDSEHVVGGRVDLATHSMGGLAARNYASQSAYGSLRNRMLGQFHTIVTLNTPEIGSKLATWLVKHRTNTRKAPLYTYQGLVWDEVCGNKDVENCFAANGYPLTGPGLPIKVGGVYALEPNSPDLTNPNLVGPNIANATWRAVSTTAPNNSALAFGLDTLIAALYSDPYGSVPTVNSILGKVPNDAIVTVASQTKGADGTGQYYTFAKLSHTSLVSSILTWLTGNNLNDNSVTDDPSGEVNQLAGCWLVASGANSCLPQEAEVSPMMTSAANVALKPVDRITVSAPEKSELGKPFELAVRLKTPGSAPAVSVYQRGEMGHTRLETVSVARVENGTVYVRVTPKLLGPVSLAVRALFADGGISVREADTYVVPPKAPPLVFKANELPTLVMTLNTPSRTAMAHPFATYPAPVGKVYLDSTFVSWRLLAKKGPPPVRLDPYGQLSALAPGEGVLEAHYGTSADRVRVLVRAKRQ